jgi:uncharacterized membrane protein
LAQYNEVIPNGAERIMAMAEAQSAHRERLETRALEAGIATQARGAYFSFTLSLIAIVGGLFLIHEGRSAEGLAAIIASLASLVSVFFYSKSEQKKERVEKMNSLEARKR